MASDVTIAITCYKQAKFIGEAISSARERGFRVIDLVDAKRRPGNGVLWQFDLLFARLGAPEFSLNAYE